MSTEEEKAKNLEQEQEQELIKDSKLSSKDDSINKKIIHAVLYRQSEPDTKTSRLEAQ